MFYDAVIVGAGPSGLAAAVRLAHFGLKVCLVEAHSRLGGLNSWHRVRGMEVSSGLHAFTNYRPDGKGVLGKLLRQLRIKFADLKLFPQGKSSIRFPSATLHFDNQPDFFRQQVAETFPAEAGGFDRFRQLILATDEGELTARQTSARDVMSQYIGDPLLADMLFCPVMFYGNPGGVGDGLDASRRRPDMDWLLFCVVWKCIFESGFSCPADGMRSIWEMLAARFQDDGGELRLAARVEALVVDAGKVTGVRLANGEDVAGRVVLSSAGTVETRRLLGHGADAGTSGGITIVEGVAILEKPASGTGLADTTVFYSFEDSLSFSAPEGLTERRNGVLCAMGNYQLPEEKKQHILKMSQLANYAAWKRLAPDAYKLAKSAAAGAMREDLARLGVDPGALRRDDGAYGFFDDMFTPLTLERFTGHAGGALYGSPVKSRNGSTECENLFLIGADQGFHGIVGAMLSGVAMANLHVLGKMI